MSDEADRADESIELMLAAAKMRRKPVLPAVGHCHNCEEPVCAGDLFCDADCRDDYERRTR